MEIGQAIVLGIIQGLTEFLPISSSAHLILLPKFFHWPDPGLAFDVALHLGTLLAVIIYFRADLWEILVHFLHQFKIKQALSNRNRKQFYPDKILSLLVLATIPGALAGYFLNDLAEQSLRNPALIALTLVFFGGLLYWADVISSRQRSLEGLNYKDALLIGLSQALALIPGTSRSGATITTGLLLGFTRQAAARFSFLLSIPIIFGAVLYKLPTLFSQGIGWYEIGGVVAAALSGYLAIAGLIKFVNKVSYKVFFWYRLFLALLIWLFLLR